jgi:hypothetical protein
MPNNDFFYSRLPVNEIPLAELLMEEHLFYKVPGNWYVVITDVEKSTTAVAGGHHETVNLIATGSMVAVLNIAYKAGIVVPAFFGGDGATFILPPGLLQPTIDALIQHRENCSNNHRLNLRVGYVPVGDIEGQNHSLLVSKLRISSMFVIPVVLGEGLAFAERIIKSPGYSIPSQSSTTVDTLDLRGMECRWDTVEPPMENQEVITLLVVANPAHRQTGVFKKVIDQLDLVYGIPEHRKPISVPRLRIKGTIKKLALEMRTKFARYKPFYLVKGWLRSLAAPYYFKTRDGRRYLDELVAMSDNLVIDGKINTVISGTAKQREELLTAFDKMEQEGLITYGFHVSRESVLSCYVRSLEENHIHFVDGAGGGYTHAASMLKKKVGQY